MPRGLRSACSPPLRRTCGLRRMSPGPNKFAPVATAHPRGIMLLFSGYEALRQSHLLFIPSLTHCSPPILTLNSLESKMTWFKKKKVCAHCKTNKTKRDFENQPTCAACRVSILIAREPQRSCPIDGTTLVKSESNEIIIDRCPKCEGIWLDAGELDAIKEAAQQEGVALGRVIG